MSYTESMACSPSSSDVSVAVSSRLYLLKSNGPRTASGMSGHKVLGSAARPESVLRRNMRERNRVKMVNQAFATLRNHVPDGSKNKKMSKVDTLRAAVSYINRLQAILNENGDESSMVMFPTHEDVKPSQSHYVASHSYGPTGGIYCSTSPPLVSSASVHYAQLSPPTSGSPYPSSSSSTASPVATTAAAATTYMADPALQEMTYEPTHSSSGQQQQSPHIVTETGYSSHLDSHQSGSLPPHGHTQQQHVDYSQWYY